MDLDSAGVPPVRSAALMMNRMHLVTRNAEPVARVARLVPVDLASGLALLLLLLGLLLMRLSAGTV
jgi:hypothetical protein